MRMNHGFDMARRSHGVAHSLWPLGNQALSCVLALIHRSMTCDRFIILSLCVNLFFLFHVLSYRLKRGAAAGGTGQFMASCHIRRRNRLSSTLFQSTRLKGQFCLVVGLAEHPDDASLGWRSWFRSARFMSPSSKPGHCSEPGPNQSVGWRVGNVHIDTPLQKWHRPHFLSQVVQSGVRWHEAHR